MQNFHFQGETILYQLNTLHFVLWFLSKIEFGFKQLSCLITGENRVIFPQLLFLLIKHFCLNSSDKLKYLQCHSSGTIQLICSDFELFWNKVNVTILAWIVLIWHLFHTASVERSNSAPTALRRSVFSFGILRLLCWSGPECSNRMLWLLGAL